MSTPIQLDSYHYKCKWCLKPHSGPTRTLAFKCIKEQTLEHGVERIYEAVSSFDCECDRPIKITFKVREYPEGILEYLGYESADAEIIVAPKVREHMIIVG